MFYLILKLLKSRVFRTVNFENQTRDDGGMNSDWILQFLVQLVKQKVNTKRNF